MKCYRCGKEGFNMLRGSYFNSDSLCPECVEREEKHPLFSLVKRLFDEEERTGKHYLFYDYPELVEFAENDSAPDELYLVPDKKKVKEVEEEDRDEEEIIKWTNSFSYYLFDPPEDPTHTPYQKKGA